jgi:hypothetical protein
MVIMEELAAKLAASALLVQSPIQHNTAAVVILSA